MLPGPTILSTFFVGMAFGISGPIFGPIIRIFSFIIPSLLLAKLLNYVGFGDSVVLVVALFGNLVIGFIIGAIIGLIVQKVKK